MTALRFDFANLWPTILMHNHWPEADGIVHPVAFFRTESGVGCGQVDGNQ
jgi:hypothetical protein